MARLPKGFRNDINIIPQKIGFEQRQSILDDIADKGTYLPKGVNIEDMDGSFVDFIGRDLSVTIDGKKIPVLFLTIQRFSEFTKTWEHTDKYKNVKIPFITVVRNPAIQQGTNQSSLWNIPPTRTYTYMKVPTWDGNRKGVDLYKIPQPTAVDITYEVRLFCNKMKDVNKLHTKVLRTFQAKQFYIKIKGHPMPIVLESIADESNIDDFENRRFYTQLFEMKLLGYILDSDDFEVVPTINRTMIVLEISDNNTGVAITGSTT